MCKVDALLFFNVNICCKIGSRLQGLLHENLQKQQQLAMHIFLLEVKAGVTHQLSVFRASRFRTLTLKTSLTTIVVVILIERRYSIFVVEKVGVR